MNYIVSSIMITMGTLITLSSSSWVSAWLGMEMNLLGFIPQIKSDNNSLSKEATMKYFLIQAIASSLFILSSTFQLTYIMSSTSMIMIMALLLKLASAPFHFWLPPLAQSMDWTPLTMMLTWQKIAPLALITMIKINMMMFILLSVAVGSLMMINQTSLKKLMVYSSINHISWSLLATMINIPMTMMYFIIYSFSVLPLSILFYKTKMTNISQMLVSNNKLKKFIMMNLLSNGGFPPFVGFFPKIMIINSLLYSNNLLLMTLIVTTTALTLFSYLRISWPLIISNSSSSKMPQNLSNFYSPFLLIPLFFPLLLFIS